MGYVIYTYIGVVYAFIFLSLWILAVFFGIKATLNALLLKFYLKKKHPEIRFTMFGFKRKNLDSFSIDNIGNFYDFIFSFGSRQTAAEWLNVFMDYNKLKELNDQKINWHLEKLIGGSSWCVRIWIIMMGSFILVVFILIPIESYFLKSLPFVQP